MKLPMETKFIIVFIVLVLIALSPLLFYMLNQDSAMTSAAKVVFDNMDKLAAAVREPRPTGGVVNITSGLAPPAGNPSDIAIDGTGHPNVIIRDFYSVEVVRINPAGVVFWRGREVIGDDQFKKAMLDLKAALAGVHRPCTVSDYPKTST